MKSEIFHNHRLPVLQDKEFVSILFGGSIYNAQMTAWLAERSKKENNGINGLLSCSRYSALLDLAIHSADVAAQLQRLGTLLLPLSFKDIESGDKDVEWDLKGAVFNQINPKYPLQMIVPRSGARGIFVINIDVVQELRRLPEDNPMNLKRLVEHELVHAYDAKIKRLQTINGKIHYDGVEVKPDMSITCEIEREIAMPHEIPAYQAQLVGLAENLTPAKMAAILKGEVEATDEDRTNTVIEGESEEITPLEQLEEKTVEETPEGE